MSALPTIHVGKKQLRLDEDTYRAMLLRVTGKTSSSAMTESERQAVVAEMRRQGFQPAPKASSKGLGSARKALSGPYAKKAQALWIALWNLGAVADRRDAALIAFVRRQTGLGRVEWVLDAGDGRAVVEALKAWCARLGVVWSAPPLSGKPLAGTPDHLTRYGYQIARAQMAILQPGATPTVFWAEVARTLGKPLFAAKPTDAEWITVMNAFGARIRLAAKKKVG